MRSIAEPARPGAMARLHSEREQPGPARARAAAAGARPRPVARQATEDQLKAWMMAGLDGDKAAHAALLRAVVPLLKGFYARRMKSDMAEVEDLVQETLIAVHERRSSYDRLRPFTAWLFSIARYKMIDHFRRSRRSVSGEDFEDLLVDEGFEQSSNAGIDIRRLLRTLPAKQARAIHDTKILGMSIVEAARAAGLGESDVKVSVHRGMRSLGMRVAAAA